MNKIFFGAAFALFFALASCSSDSASPPDDFFNINAGNEWVYKRYNYDDDIPGVYTFSGITDSVKVLNIVTLDGLQFSRVQHKLTNENNANFLQINYEYLRVNSNGQLVGLQGQESAEATDAQYDIVETTGSMFHPGNIENYQNTVEQPMGTNLYFTIPQMTVSVEGNPYTVVPYFHQLTSPDTSVRKVEMDYEQQTGMVKSQCIVVSSGEGYEDRLVSYDLN